MGTLEDRLQRLEVAFGVIPQRATLICLILASHGDQEALQILRLASADDPLLLLILGATGT